jgi:hypothetical protein
VIQIRALQFSGQESDMAATFVVEDGTGLATANSYLSEADADTYHENHDYPLAWFGLAGTTYSMDDSDNSINDSASGFVNVGFVAGMRLITTGFTEAANNSTWTVVSVVAGKMVLKDGTVVTEVAGDSVTIEPDKEHYLRLGTNYLDVVYNAKWQGMRANDAQALDWPRSGIVDSDGYTVDDDEVPAAIENATAYMALKSMEGDTLIPDQATPGEVKSKRVKVGPIEKDVEYMGGLANVKRYPIVEGYLRDLVDMGQAASRG